MTYPFSMVVSDFRINSGVRSCLARHWIDLQQLSFGSFRGVVRISGMLCHLGEGSSAALRAADVVLLEAEILRVPGVGNVFFDLSNWKKASGGGWERLDRSVQGSGAGSSGFGDRGYGGMGVSGSAEGSSPGCGSVAGAPGQVVLQFFTRGAAERGAGEAAGPAERRKP